MTLAAELVAALPRGVHIAVHGPTLFVTTKHADGLHVITASVAPPDELIPVVALELRRHVERWGPIAATIPGEA